VSKGNSLDSVLAGGEVLSGTGAMSPVPYSGFFSLEIILLIKRRVGARLSLGLNLSSSGAICDEFSGSGVVKAAVQG